MSGRVRGMSGVGVRVALSGGPRRWPLGQNPPAKTTHSLTNPRPAARGGDARLTTGRLWAFMGDSVWVQANRAAKLVKRSRSGIDDARAKGVIKTKISRGRSFCWFPDVLDWAMYSCVACGARGAASSTKQKRCRNCARLNRYGPDVECTGCGGSRPNRYGAQNYKHNGVCQKCSAKTAKTQPNWSDEVPLEWRVSIRKRMSGWNRVAKKAGAATTSPNEAFGVLAAQGFRCFYTGWVLTEANASPDHAVPHSAGGSYGVDNMVWCSWEVNMAKSTMSPKRYIQVCRAVARIHRQATSLPGFAAGKRAGV